MAQIAYRANLATGHFPFLARQQGQTIIVGGKDQAFNNSLLQTAADEDKDKGIPQVYYCHNVVPTGNGLQSVGFDTKLTGLLNTNDFQDIFILRDSNENKFLFSPSGNKNYLYDATVANWASLAAAVPDIASNAIVTTAYINGETYIYFQGVGCYKYNTATKNLVSVTLIGITPALLNGICAASGFLVAWDDFNVYRAQATNPLDFTPDPSLGSGASIPEDIKGKIVCCLPIINGFIIYCTKNAVGATFSQNIRFPFIYKEVKGSAGILLPSHVTWQDNSGEHYAWTQAGLQKVDKTQAILINAAATDMLTSKIFEDYDTVTDSIITTKLTGALLIRLAIVGRRWLVISYGITSFTHALYYDLAFRRWGRLKITHAAAFELYLPTLYGNITWNMLGTLTWDDLGTTTWADLSTQLFTNESTKEILAFLLPDGTVKVVNFDATHTNDSGVVVLGKYQFVRERNISIQEMEIENIDPTYNFQVRYLTSLDGKNISRITTPYLYSNNGLYRKYLSDVEGKNHSIAYIGTFHLSSLELKLKVEGHT